MNAFIKQFNIFRKKPEVTEEISVEEEVAQPSQRPLTLDDYIGQDLIKSQARLKINLAKKHDTAFCHTLLLGHAGAGKTTFAKIIAAEMGVPFYEFLGSNLNNGIVLCNLLERLPKGAILFIDEIHMLNKTTQEFLYPVLEDSKYLYHNSDKGVDLNKFTIIGCTTHAGMLNHPFMERFAWKPTLAPYSKTELSELIKRTASRKYGFDIDNDVSLSLASLCQGTPRKAVHLIQNFIDVASCSFTENRPVVASDLTLDVLTQTVQSLDMDPMLGLDRPFRDYLNVLQNEKGKPIGLRSLSAMCHQQEVTLLNAIEPFLLLPNIELPVDDSNVISGSLAKVTRGGRAATPSTVAYLRACKNLQENHGWFPGEIFNVD